MDIKNYHAEISKHKFLSKEEERVYLEEYKSSDASDSARKKAKEKIVYSNLRFAFKQAWNAWSRLGGGMTTFEDLLCASNEGLIKGLEKYDMSSDVRFISYAGYWINQCIHSELAKARIVSIPIWKQQLLHRILKEVKNDETLKISEVLASNPTVNENDLKMLCTNKHLTFYIDDLSAEEDGFISNPIEEVVEERIFTSQLLDKVECLPDRVKQIIQYSFGLNDGEQLSAVAISPILNIPVKEVRRLKSEGLDSLRSLLSVEDVPYQLVS